MTLTHESFTFTEMPPSTASAQNRPNNTQASLMRSVRRGTLQYAPRSASAIGIPIAPEKMRFSCSMAAWCPETSTSLVALQFGQSAQPSPEFVRRTTAPLTMIATSNTTLTQREPPERAGRQAGRAHRRQCTNRTSPVADVEAHEVDFRSMPANYDEFSLFPENADEFGIPWTGPPRVRRTDVEVAPGRRVSALRVGYVAARARTRPRRRTERAHLGHRRARARRAARRARSTGPRPLIAS